MLDAEPAPLSANSRSHVYAPRERLLDRYELTRPIGEGGTAVVWAAWDSVLDVDVAVKIVVPPKQDMSALLKRRTISEARVCAQLADPAVCRVLDFGFSDRGDPVIVSEFLRGETLDELLTRETRLPATRAVQTLLPILDALSVAHDKGIVHRDVKPANIFLSAHGDHVQPKLLDFGIACWFDGRSRTTTTGTICGTPCYMSTEQARGVKDIGFKSDLWSFCATLYEVIAGEPAFIGDNYNATLFAILNTEPAPLSAVAGVDAELCAIVMRGLSKNPDGRWASAAELGSALARWLLDRGIESDICDVSLRRRLPGTEREPISSHPPARVGRPVSRGRAALAAALRRSTPKQWAIALGCLALFGAGGGALVSAGDPETTRDARAEQPPPAAGESLRVDAHANRRSAAEATRAAAPPEPANEPGDATVVAASNREPSESASAGAALRREEVRGRRRVSARKAAGAAVERAPAAVPSPAAAAPAPPGSTPPRREDRRGNALAYDFGI